MPIALLLLLLANLVPLAGVALLGWSVYQLVMLFWLENVVIGLYAILKLACFGLMNTSNAPAVDRTPSATYQRGIVVLLIPFFMVHFGGFTAGHFVFLTALFDARGLSVVFGEHSLLMVVYQMLGREPLLLVSFIALVISHGYTFLHEYIGHEQYEHTTSMDLMFAPYPRILVMQVGVLSIGVFAYGLGEPVWAMAILVAAKVVLDLVMYKREHRRHAAFET